MYVLILIHSLIKYVARVTGVRVEALNSTAVNVSWTPVTLQETDYIITIHYTLVFQVLGGQSSSSSGENL